MKRKFLATRNAIVSDQRLIIGGVFIAIACFFLLLRLVAPQLLSTLTSPLSKGGTSMTAATGSFFSSFTDRAALVAERDTLQHHIDALTAREQALMEELADMRTLLGSREHARSEIPASVLQRPPVSPYDTFLVNAGTADGVTVNAQVSGPGGVPVGSVSQAEARTAYVTLFSSSGRETEGWAGEERTPVTLRGEGAGAFSATVPQGTNLAIGDMIIVPGFTSAPIGTVRAIHNDPSSPVFEISIRPFVNPFSMTWVAIEKK